ELGLPQQRARVLVERAELGVLGSGNEDKSTGRNDRTAVHLSPGRRNAPRLELGELAQRNAPAILAAIQVDRAQRPPRWLDRRIAGRITPAFVADELVA